MSASDAISQAAAQLDEYLSRFSLEDQEAIIRYALDHIVPRMKGLNGRRAPMSLAEKGAALDAATHVRPPTISEAKFFSKGIRAAEKHHNIIATDGSSQC